MKYINLDNVCEFVRNGASIKQDSQCNEGIPITRIETISNDKFNFDRLGYANIKDDKYSDYYLKDKDVLLSHINSAKYLGRSVLYRKKDENPIIHGMNLLCLRFIKDKYLPDYFVYYSQSNVAKAYIQKHTKLAVNQASITSTAIKDMPIPMIEMGKQKEISKSLDKCNEIIHKHKQLLSKYDFLIKSRFIEMFGDPIQNPMGWEKTELGNMCKEVRYGTSKPATENGKYTYLRMNNITFEGELDLANTKTIDISDEELPKCSVQKGDILFNRTNSIELCGKTCLYKLDETMVIAGYIIRVRVNEKLNPQYVSTFFNTKSIKKLLREMAKGAVNQANINAQEMQSIQIPVPPIALQNEYDGFVQQIDKSKFEIWLYLNLCYIIEKRVFTYD